MEEKKKRPKKAPSKKQEALAHIERILIYGAPYYKKLDVIKLLREFLELYWR